METFLQDWADHNPIAFALGLLSIVIASRALYELVMQLAGRIRLALYERRMRIEDAKRPRMSADDFKGLIRGLEADGWTYDPTFYRFTKPGKRDFVPDHAPHHWPKAPGENIAMRGIMRAIAARNSI